MFASTLLIFAAFNFVQSAKILIVTPTPSISHQVVFRSLIRELINRDHEVIFVTPDPMFPPDKSPRNLKEIDVHNVSYSLWTELSYATDKSVTSDLSFSTVPRNFKLLHKVIHHQLMEKSVLKLLKDKTMKFDLLILEECTAPALIFSHIFKAPVILMSSLGDCRGITDVLGGITHPIMYPKFFERKLYDLMIWEKIAVLYRYIIISWMLETTDSFTDTFLQNFLDSKPPETKQLKHKVEMLFLNLHPLWTHNQPVPSNVVSIWGIHNTTEQKLQKDLQDYLNSSGNGVIYVSFGSNIKTATIHPEVLKIFLSVFSRLPLNILWKWDENDLPGKSKNIKIAKWLPQKDILRHPNVKLFITQGGLQSTEEAINAAVPLVGIPIFADQHYNVEKYLYFKIGIKLHFTTLTIEDLENGIKSILENYDSYRRNIINLRTQMQDQPNPPIEKVIWWIEYVIRHGGTRHLRSLGANISWIEYYELELVVLVFSGLIVSLTFTLLKLYSIFRRVYSLLLIKYKILLKYFCVSFCLFIETLYSLAKVQ